MNGGKTVLKKWWLPCQMEEYVKHSWNLGWVSFFLMAFITNGKQLFNGESPYHNDIKPERENKHFRDGVWSPNHLDELMMYSGGSRMLFSRGKEEDEQHSTRSNRLQEQGVQNWAGGWRTPHGFRADQFMGCLVSNLVVTCACCSCFGLYSQKHLGTQIQLISAGVLLLNTF